MSSLECLSETRVIHVREGLTPIIINCVCFHLAGFSMSLPYVDFGSDCEASSCCPSGADWDTRSCSYVACTSPSEFDYHEQSR